MVGQLPMGNVLLARLAPGETMFANKTVFLHESSRKTLLAALVGTRHDFKLAGLGVPV